MLEECHYFKEILYVTQDDSIRMNFVASTYLVFE
jgi:hypothetical protein